MKKIKSLLLNLNGSRYKLLLSFVACFVLLSFLIRSSLLVLSIHKIDFSLISLVKIYGIGLVFDFGVAFYLVFPYTVYLLLMPERLYKTSLNRVITYIGFFITLLIIVFSFFAEITFWQEFESRFNFIAVDYLIYTYEVINNINESYPLPILILGMLIFCSFLFYLFYKFKVFQVTFHQKTTFLKRLSFTGIIFSFIGIFTVMIDNSVAEKNSNRYQNELSKAGIYSFFAAFKNNELSYDHFYQLISTDKAFSKMRLDLYGGNSTFTGNQHSIRRKISAKGNELKPNVIMITIESFSADFMNAFGGNQNLTPVLDSLAGEGVFFTNMYATGTRTVRGMEALSLALPPTPGSSIVRRTNNDNLLTVGHIFNVSGYETSFLYGGDGYFDNMNQYFGSNGYNIVDRGRSIVVKDKFKAERTIIPDSSVSFENAWGICDEDLYDAVERNADEHFKTGKPFYDFVMTTSNHKPYTFPPGKINMLSGSGRSAAVRYTDYSIGAFLKKAKSKPWFQNTVFIFVADHCASSAGKNEIDITKYHIPCIIYNPVLFKPQRIEKVCSQIDIYPTLFSQLNWSYESNLYGKDVLSSDYSPRILLGTYQKLAYMKEDSLVILSPQQKVETYIYNKSGNLQIPTKFSNPIIEEAISQYQSAYFLYKNNGLKQF